MKKRKGFNKLKERQLPSRTQFRRSSGPFISTVSRVGQTELTIRMRLQRGKSFTRTTFSLAWLCSSNLV
jgi:hypothetical protein